MNLVFQNLLPLSACFHLTFETGIVTTGEPNASHWARFGDRGNPFIQHVAFNSKAKNMAIKEVSESKS